MRILERLSSGGYQLCTCSALIIEAYTLIRSELGYDAAMTFLDSMDQSRIRKFRVKATDEDRAKAILRRYRDKDFSFTDAISFAMMERFGIPIAFAFDQHFAQYGIRLARPADL